MSYKAFYILRDDGDWDLAAMVANENEIDQELSIDIETRIKQALAANFRNPDNYCKVEESDDPHFVQVWSEK